MPNIKRKIALFATNYILAGTRSWSFKVKRRLLNWGGFSIGENTKIVGPILVFGELSIGNDTWIGRNLTVNGNGKVIIGNKCDIAPEVTFQTGGHAIGEHIRRAGVGENYTQIVGDGVWIGGRVTILNNVTIHEGSVVAGCACVTKDIPSDVLVGGVPAKKIKEL